MERCGCGTPPGPTRSAWSAARCAITRAWRPQPPMCSGRPEAPARDGGGVDQAIPRKLLIHVLIHRTDQSTAAKAPPAPSRPETSRVWSAFWQCSTRNPQNPDVCRQSTQCLAEIRALFSQGLGWFSIVTLGKGASRPSHRYRLTSANEATKSQHGSSKCGSS